MIQGGHLRKRTIGPDSDERLSTDQNWLEIERLATVEVTSEQAEYPIESALIPGGSPGWRASGAGEQTIRLLFDEPLTLNRISLVFEDDRRQRTQEFVLGWSEVVEGLPREIVRQQYTFAPSGTTCEVEDYAVSLKHVRLLELRIVPDITGGDAQASLTSMRLA